MTPEARLGFVLFFFAAWCSMALIAWAIAAVVARGRGALPALPIGLGAACVAAVAVPLVGLDNFAGFFLSLAIAFVAGAVGSFVGIRIAQKLWPARDAAGRRPAEPAPDAEVKASHGSPDH